VEDMFSQKKNDNNEGGEGSIISELTGLTAVFKDVPQHIREEEEEQEDPDLHIIMEQLLRDRPPGRVRNETTTANNPRPTTQVRSCLSSNYRPSRPVGSILSTTSRASTASSKKLVSKKLRFSTVAIRHYERILTENPSTIQGPSVGIGWRFQQAPATDLNAYEAQRGQPVPSPQLVMSRPEREQLLISLGVTPADMAAAVRNNVKARDQRRRTVQSLTTFAPLEGAVKKLFNPFGKSKN
jgi:hypothetical protein